MARRGLKDKVMGPANALQSIRLQSKAVFFLVSSIFCFLIGPCADAVPLD